MTFRVFTCNDFHGHWAIGSAAVVVAKDESEARIILANELLRDGLILRDTDTLKELDITAPGVLVLNNGDY